MAMAQAVQPAGSGLLAAVKTFDAGALRRALVRDDLRGHYRREREHLLLHNQRESTWRRDLLAWLRDHVHKDIPRAYYDLEMLWGDAPRLAWERPAAKAAKPRTRRIVAE